MSNIFNTLQLVTQLPKPASPSIQPSPKQLPIKQLPTKLSVKQMIPKQIITKQLLTKQSPLKQPSLKQPSLNQPSTKQPSLNQPSPKQPSPKIEPLSVAEEKEEEEDDDDCKQLFVGNVNKFSSFLIQHSINSFFQLPFQCQWQDLKDLFRSSGRILRADVVLNFEGRSRGFGTVLFANHKDAKQAIGKVFFGTLAAFKVNCYTQNNTTDLSFITEF